MERKKIINIPIYHGKLTIIETDDVVKSGEKYKQDLSGFDAGVFRNHCKNGYMRYVVVLEKGVTNKIIAHECFHIVCMIFKDRHIEIDLNNDEPTAYFLGWIVGEIDKFVT